MKVRTACAAMVALGLPAPSHAMPAHNKADPIMETCLLETDAAGHPVATVQIGGRDVKAIIDTAASLSVIDSNYASTRDLAHAGQTRVSGMSGAGIVNTVQGQLIELCGLSFQPKTMPAINLADILGDAASPIKVILGNDFLLSSPLRLDFPRNRIMPLHQPTSARFADWGRLQLSPSGRIQVPLSVNGLEAMGTIDTGSAVPLYISPALYERLRAGGLTKTSEALSAGVEGLLVARTFIVKAMRIGNADLRDIPAQSPDKWADESDVVVGAPVVMRFSLALDPTASRIGLTAEAADRKRAFPRDRSGMNVRRLGAELEVVFVAPNSPADSAGIDVGDRIVAVDDQPIGAKLFATRPRLGAEPVGTVQHLRMASGKTKVITLSDYF